MISDILMRYAISIGKGYAYGQTIESPLSQGVHLHEENLSAWFLNLEELLLLEV